MSALARVLHSNARVVPSSLAFVRLSFPLSLPTSRSSLLTFILFPHSRTRFPAFKSHSSLLTVIPLPHIPSPFLARSNAQVVPPRRQLAFVLPPRLALSSLTPAHRVVPPSLLSSFGFLALALFFLSASLPGQLLNLANAQNDCDQRCSCYDG